MTGYSERSAAVAGGDLRVWEKGQGPGICYFAGLAGLPRWLPVLDRLAESHRVAAPSLPGAPGGHPADLLDEHVDWLLAARDAHRAADTTAARWSAHRPAGRSPPISPPSGPGRWAGWC